jgi:hypothetical protein
MSSERRRRGSSARLRTAVRILVALLMAGMAAAPAAAVSFYKWTDDRGEVHYGDTPPKAFAATAKRIDVDTAPHAAARPRPPIVEPVLVPQPAVAAPDPLTQRRLTRARLEKNLEDARARLDLAQKALAETASPQEGEQQVVQGQPLPIPPDAPVPNAGSGHSNCTSVATPNGRRVFCPHLVPGEEYYARIDRMQEAVRVAQQAVEDAELAYRQGVD